MLLKPNDKRAKLAIVFLFLISIIQIISILSDYLQIVLLQTSYTIIEAEENDLRQRIIGLLIVIFQILSLITFIQWFRRAYFNLHVHASNLEYSEGWAAGSWFVPFINLVRPYKIAKELYVETQKILSHSNSSYRTMRPTYFIGIWWTLWIISGFLDRISFKMAMKAETIEELSDLATFNILSTTFSIFAAFMTIKIVYDYSEIEADFFSSMNNQNNLVTESQEIIAEE